MSKVVETLANVAIVAAAVAIATAVVMRETRPSQSEVALERIENWDEVLAASVPISPRGATAAVTIVEFTDFQCSACAYFHKVVLPEALRGFESVVEYRIAHFPLGQHGLAQPAAAAFECAVLVGGAREYADALFRHQDSLEVLGWGEVARRAGIRRMSEFDACVGSAPSGRVEAGRLLAERMQLRGTPTILVNGSRFNGVPSIGRLRETFIALGAVPKAKELPRN